MRILLLSIWMFIFLVPSAYSADPLTVGEAMAIAARKHPQVVEAREVVAGAEARVGQARANYYPQITVAADWNNSRSFLPSLGGIKETELHSAAAYLRPTTYDFGRTSGAVSAGYVDKDFPPARTVWQAVYDYQDAMARFERAVGKE